MVIDTVNDLVISDIDDKIVNTGGVAVRPFWWGNEYLEELGLKTYLLDKGLSGKEDSDSAANNDSASDITSGNALESGVSVFWDSSIRLFAIILVTVAAAIVATTYFRTRKQKFNAPVQSTPLEQYQPGDQSSFPSYCSNCGKFLTPGSNYCPGCGKQIMPD